MSKFTLIDRAVGYFSPTAGLRRAHDRQLLNKYQAALPANPHTKKRNKRSTGNANQLNKGAKVIRERARHYDENNPHVTAILDELVVNVVGANGIMVEPQPLDKNGEVHVECARRISDWFETYSLHQNIDGELSRAETEQLACRTWLRDGEVFARHYMGNNPQITYPTATPFAVQPFEPDFIPAHISEPERGLLEGIQRNKLGQAIKYLIQRDSLGFEFAEVDAYYISHLKFTRRLHQNRGVSLLHSVLDLIADLEDYDQSERISAQIASRFAYFTKSVANENMGSDGFVGAGDEEIALGYGNSFSLAPGEDAGVIESNRREAMSAPFRDGQLRMTSAGTGVNNSSVTRHYTGPYSSQRQELVDSFSRYKVLQRRFVTGWTRPQYRHALQMAMLSGELKIPQGVKRDTILNAIYQAPVMPWIDPKKEMDGIEKSNRLGLQSLSHSQRERNINPLATRREIQAERKAMDEMGIVSTSDPKHNLADQIQHENKRGDDAETD
ncbi:phage portal protein [Salinivibrio proteolyticus]|uniref:phage portal protein n=1 Tax=Salinivibrio proteolyticus TaxID=334715 RepID=UPI000988AAAB|nr:phage portal protein [Salinivibrio proteolyticus]OOF25056.1 phage portal protein [Salinivibrio proteolyticus]